MITLIIVVLLISGGLSIKAVWKISTLPKWAETGTNNIWGVSFFDKRVWLKNILIRIIQPFIIVVIFLYKIIVSAWQIASKIVASRKQERA